MAGSEGAWNSPLKFQAVSHQKRCVPKGAHLFLFGCRIQTDLLRASEILGLKWTGIDGDYIHIRRAVVTGKDGPIKKVTKTYRGTRAIHILAYIKQLLDAQPRNKEHIINMSEKAIYSGFVRICQKQGLPHFRFHDLCHVNASLMLAVGAPDKYAMKRMGHATNNMLKTVYQHTIKEKELMYDTQLETYLEILTLDE